MWNLGIMVFVCCVTVAATAASARVDSICSGASELRQEHGRARIAQAIDTPFSAIETFGRLSGDLRENLLVYATADQIRIAGAIARSARELRRIADPKNPGHSELSATTYSVLEGLLDDLTQIESNFGCEPARPEGVRSELQPTARASVDSERHWLNFVPATSSPLIYLGIFIILLSLAVMTYVIRAFRRQHERHMCRIPLHIIYGEQCTITSIIDISRSGMKVEAAAQDTGQGWIEFHFCGRKVDGMIVWRTKYFAGVKFRKNLTTDALASVLKNNLKPLRDAGIEKTSTECFFVGCHLNCSKHLPTAISLKNANSNRTSG